jgi:hypothetical protein
MTRAVTRRAMSDQPRRSLPSTVVVHSALLLTAVFLFAGKAGAQDPSCKPVVDAAVLQARTPSHVYSSMTGPNTNLTSETITTNSFVYMRSNVKGADQWKNKLLARGRGSSSCCQQWSVHQLSARRRRDHQRRSGGDLHRVNKKSGISGKAWISKRRGLPLKGELTLSSGHVSMRYEYDNVRPPGMQ